jgi:hypothetical protein
MQNHSVIHLRNFHHSQICQMLNRVGLQNDINYGGIFNEVCYYHIQNQFIAVFYCGHCGHEATTMFLLWLDFFVYR